MTKKNEKKQTEEQQDPVQEMRELLQRTQANFENYRKQTEKRIEDIREMASRNIILEILPVMDNFTLALKSADTNTNPRDFLAGVELIYSQLFDVLKNSGIETINTENQTFDPFYHEALMKVESDLPENTIVEELQKGFMLNDKVIRHARVKVSAGKSKK